MPALNLSANQGVMSLSSSIDENISFGLIYTNNILTAQVVKSSKNEILISKTFRINALPVSIVADINEISKCNADIGNSFGGEAEFMPPPEGHKIIYFEVDIEGGFLFSCKLLSTELIQLEIAKNHNIDFFSMEIGFFQDGNEFWLSNKMPVGSRAVIKINEI